MAQIAFQLSLLSSGSTAAGIDDILFNLLADIDTKTVSLHKFWKVIQRRGIHTSDPRLAETKALFTEYQLHTGADHADLCVEKEVFKSCLEPNIKLLAKIFRDDLIIPEFYNFIPRFKNVFRSCARNARGKCADYIPQLARVDPGLWGAAVCSIDGQSASFGDAAVPFCLHSCHKPLTYAIAVSMLGSETVHNYVGREPSGRSFNELTLNDNNRPHNPLINSGSIVTCSLIKPREHISDRFDFIFEKIRALAGNSSGLGFSNATFLSERDTSDRNFALGYYMSENKCFSDEAQLQHTLEFYFQLCSIEVTCESGSVIAATLANGGVCPITGNRVLEPEAVRNVLSLMHTCGMSKYSGEFAFKVGLPAKSGISGVIMLVVPKVMGVCMYSPRVDESANSYRGIQFCEDLVKVFNLHTYDSCNEDDPRWDPRKRSGEKHINAVVKLLFAAATGDIDSIHKFALSGMNMSAPDYDGRTALHLAAAEGHLEIVQVLLDECHVNPQPKDRWGFRPIDDARKFKHRDVVHCLKSHMSDLQQLIPRRTRDVRLLQVTEVTDDSGCDQTDEEDDEDDYIELEAVTVKSGSTGKMMTTSNEKKSDIQTVTSLESNHSRSVPALQKLVKPEEKLSDKATEMADEILNSLPKMGKPPEESKC